MKTLTISLIIILLYSCAAQKATIEATINYPYCGGAKPTPEMAAGRKEPAANFKFAIVDKNTKKIIQWTELDADGKWKGDLTKGDYLIFREDKLLTSEELIKKYNLFNTEFFSFSGVECLEKWKLEPDFEWNLKSKATSTISFDIKSKCHVGISPCLEYIGPKVN